MITCAICKCPLVKVDGGCIWFRFRSPCRPAKEENMTVKNENETSEMMIERDEYARVWCLNEHDAAHFFGWDDPEVVMLKSAPETDREKEKYKPEAKLYGVRPRAKREA